MRSIDKTLKYYELLLACDEIPAKRYALPSGYRFEMYSGEQDIEAWINIHIESEEFTSKARARGYFYQFYGGFLDELKDRLFFVVEDCTNKKVATATLSKADEFGYSCVVDWFAVSKASQGKGLSKPMLSKIFDIAQSLNESKVLLHTQTHTYLAVKIYLDYGFNPFNVEDDYGFRIVSSILDHEKLQAFKKVAREDMFDNTIINIVNRLDGLFSHYTFEVWNTNGRNDVFVRQDDKVYFYKFFDDGNTLIKQSEEDDE